MKEAILEGEGFEMTVQALIRLRKERAMYGLYHDDEQAEGGSHEPRLFEVRCVQPDGADQRALGRAYWPVYARLRAPLVRADVILRKRLLDALCTP